MNNLGVAVVVFKMPITGLPGRAAALWIGSRLDRRALLTFGGVPQAYELRDFRPASLSVLPPTGHALHWSEADAGGDVAARRCVHDVPLNVFCGRCEG